jgi:hypothetical protein
LSADFLESKDDWNKMTLGQITMQIHHCSLNILWQQCGGGFDVPTEYLTKVILPPSFWASAPSHFKGSDLDRIPSFFGRLSCCATQQTNLNAEVRFCEMEYGVKSPVLLIARMKYWFGTAAVGSGCESSTPSSALKQSSVAMSVTLTHWKKTRRNVS